MLWMTESPWAARAARSIAIPARISGLSTTCPCNGDGPEITARCGSHSTMRAPMPISLSTKNSRDSNSFSNTSSRPSHCEATTIAIDIRSAGNAGQGPSSSFGTCPPRSGRMRRSWSASTMSLARSRRGRTPSRSNAISVARRSSGRTPSIVTAPFVTAASPRNEPISMWSGPIVKGAGRRGTPPSTVSVLLPIPSIRPPRPTRYRARSCTCGSLAALRRIVVPAAATAAMRAFSVAVTLGSSRKMSAPRSVFASSWYVAPTVISVPNRSSARKWVSTRRRPITSPPGGGRFTRPNRASIGPASRMDARIRAESLGSSSRGSAAAVFTSTELGAVHATAAPKWASSSSMVSTSRMWGTLSMRQGPSASRVAARMGSAAFLFPAGRIVPLSGRPPETRNDGGIGDRKLRRGLRARQACANVRPCESGSRARAPRRRRAARRAPAAPVVDPPAFARPRAHRRRSARPPGTGARTRDRAARPAAVARARPADCIRHRVDRRGAGRALRVALRASHPARHLAACGSGSGGRLPRRGAGRLAARPACTEPRGGVGAAPPHRARPRGGRRGVGARGGHGGGTGRRRGAPPGTRPAPRRRARDGSRRARDGRPAGPTSSRGVDRIRRERRGSGRMGVLERDAPRPRGPGSHGAARRQRAARRGSRLCDRRVALHRLRARGLSHGERLAAAGRVGDRAARVGAPDVRPRPDHQRRAARAAHGLDHRCRACAAGAPHRRALGQHALCTAGAPAARPDAALWARDGGPGGNGARARGELLHHLRLWTRESGRRSERDGRGRRGADDDGARGRAGAIGSAAADAARGARGAGAVDTRPRAPRAYGQCAGGLTEHDSVLGGGSDGDLTGDPGAGGDRDRPVVRHRGARLADISADPRASGRTRRERRPPARGDDPDRGGESGGDVARAARPDREGGGRSRDPSRRSGRAVRGRPGGGRNDDARRSGHAPKRAARPLGTRMGAARGQAPEEALRAGRLLAATAAPLAGIALLPAVAHAWTPGTHVYLGESVLANLHQLPAALADLLRAFPYDYLYGNIAADTSLAKKYAPVGRHCHAWHVGQEIFDLAPTDPLRAFGLGYLSHLAADAVAHNF